MITNGQANALYDIKQYVAKMSEHIENIEKIQIDTNKMLTIILKSLKVNENDGK